MPQVSGVPAELCVQGAEFDRQTMIYHRYIVILHISYHLISSNYHQGTTGRALWWGLCPLTAEISPACDEEGWLTINAYISNLFKRKASHNVLFFLFLQQNHIHKNLDQKLRFLPFKSSIYIKGLGAPPSPLADLCCRLAGPALSLLPYSVDLFC